MTAKEYLGQIKRYDVMIQNKLTEVSQLRLLATGISSCNCEERVQTSGSKDRLGETVAKIVDIEKEIDNIVDEIYLKKKTIIKQLEGLENTDYYNILFNRYVAGKELSKIADDMGYSYRQMIRIHGKALLEFEKRYLSMETM